MHPRAAELIATLRLDVHPEGGFYREVYRSASRVTPEDGRGVRCALTAIYFLLPAGSHSRWHRVRSDEVWHLYEGGPLELLEVDAGTVHLSRHRLSIAASKQELPVHVVTANRWQAARPLGDYALVVCIVAPGFEFDDFLLLADDAAGAGRMRESWPELAVLL